MRKHSLHATLQMSRLFLYTLEAKPALRYTRQHTLQYESLQHGPRHCNEGPGRERTGVPGSALHGGTVPKRAHHSEMARGLFRPIMQSSQARQDWQRQATPVQPPQKACFPDRRNHFPLLQSSTHHMVVMWAAGCKVAVSHTVPVLHHETFRKEGGGGGRRRLGMCARPSSCRQGRTSDDMEPQSRIRQ